MSRRGKRREEKKKEAPLFLFLLGSDMKIERRRGRKKNLKKGGSVFVTACMFLEHKVKMGGTWEKDRRRRRRTHGIGRMR